MLMRLVLHWMGIDKVLILPMRCTSSHAVGLYCTPLTKTFASLRGNPAVRLKSKCGPLKLGKHVSKKL